MKTIKKKCVSLLITSITLTAAVPVGVIMLITGASQGKPLIMWIGIMLAVVGFYGTPMAWIGYGGSKKHESLCLAVEKDGLRKLSDISSMINETEDYCRALVKTATAKRYLVGYKLNDDETELIPFERPNKQNGGKKVAVKCESCGATSVVGADDMRCPYCGGIVHESKKK